MYRIYTVCGFVAIAGYITETKELFHFFSIICIVLIGIGSLNRSYNLNKFYGSKQRSIATFIGGVIMYSLIMSVAYYFLPNFISWCVDIYCATAIFNWIKRKSRNIQA